MTSSSLPKPKDRSFSSYSQRPKSTLRKPRSNAPAIAIALILLSCSGFAADEPNEEELSGRPAEIVGKYLEATEKHDSSRNVSMEVDINAAVPSLNQHGQLHALRTISKMGQITYHVLAFKGDNTVKNQVIARYLQAEQQGHGDPSLAIAPANYKFKYKGEKTLYRRKAYLFQLSPRHKKVGLFKGEIWLDAETYLPLFEKGRFVKNPSLFFKRVMFERAFSVENGIAIPQYMSSLIQTRLVGRVALDIFYSNFETTPPASQAEASTPAAAPR